MTTAEIMSNMKESGIESAQAQQAMMRLVDTGMRLKDAWVFAFEKAFAILESMDDPDTIIVDLGHFIEENCTYKAYIPYANLVQLFEDNSSNELTDELFVQVCDLLSEIAEAAIEHYKKKFSF